MAGIFEELKQRSKVLNIFTLRILREDYEHEWIIQTINSMKTFYALSVTIQLLVNIMYISGFLGQSLLWKNLVRIVSVFINLVIFYVLFYRTDPNGLEEFELDDENK